MSKRPPQKQQIGPNSTGFSSLPNFIRFKNVTNQSNQPQGASEMFLLRSRIQELQSKVATLQEMMSSKKKRIRRKSNEVDRRFECETCHKMYGSVVSLNLHLRIKHNQGDDDKQPQDDEQVPQN